MKHLPDRKLWMLSLLNPGEGFMFWSANVATLRTLILKEGHLLGCRFSTVALKNGLFVWRLGENEKRQKISLDCGKDGRVLKQVARGRKRKKHRKALRVQSERNRRAFRKAWFAHAATGAASSDNHGV